jgi:hypothetical protein
MKYIYTLISLVLLLSTQPVSAQSSSAEIIAQANIQSVITATTISNLDLGELVPGTVTTIDPTDVTAGQFNITSSNNNTRFIYTIANQPLTQTVTGTQLPYTLIIRGSGIIDDTAELFTIQSGTTYNSGPANGGPFGSRLRSIFIGAEVGVPEDQEGGVYQSVITLTVDIL